MIIVTSDHLPHGIFPFLSCFLIRLAPEIGHIRHDKQAQFIGPIKFAGHLYFDMNPVAIQANLLGSDNFIPHKFITGVSIVSIGMVSLVETQLQVNWPIVQSHIWQLSTRKIHNADLTHAKVS